MIEALIEAMGKPKKAFRIAALKAMPTILPSLFGDWYSKVSSPMLHALEMSSKARSKV